jgi:hypothetical protein
MRGTTFNQSRPSPVERNKIKFTLCCNWSVIFQRRLCSFFDLKPFESGFVSLPLFAFSLIKTQSQRILHITLGTLDCPLPTPLPKSCHIYHPDEKIQASL